ncbi:hypothetical protein DUD43_06490 [Alcaligenes faecalis]|uniref:hypothetical protein n=1 Tax=Alcaligenes faecalis TaxID=511 RepID=UPI001294139B|nr:hypothetical protein [Alcaligenes faecalis]QFY77350.1 hypothetical protein DUD43_06490 [Alcaligenes faecalis]
MSFDSQTYGETYFIAGQEFKGTAQNGGKISIPYTVLPPVEVGDTVHKKAGNGRVGWVVQDISCYEDGTMNIGTEHDHLLILTVESEVSRNKMNSPTYNINTLNGHTVQLGQENSIVMNITVEDLVRKVAESSDEESKSRLGSFLESSAAKAILGVGIPVLAGLLKG